MFKKMVLAIMLVGGALALSGCWDEGSKIIMPSGIECDSIKIDRDEIYTNLKVKNECIDDSTLSEISKLVDFKIDSENHQIFRDVKDDHDLASSNYFGFNVEITGKVIRHLDNPLKFKVEIENQIIKFNILLKRGEQRPPEDKDINIIFIGRIKEISKNTIYITNGSIK